VVAGYADAGSGTPRIAYIADDKLRPLSITPTGVARHMAFGRAAQDSWVGAVVTANGLEAFAAPTP
jgi:hypothetical protein